MSGVCAAVRFLFAALTFSVSVLLTPVFAAENLPALNLPESFESALLQQKQLPGMSRPLEARGRFYFSRQQGVFYQLDAPIRARYLADARQLVMQEGSAPARRLPAAQAAGLEAIHGLFQALFGGSTAALSDSFELAQETTADGWRLRLTPKLARLKTLWSRIEVQGAAHVQQLTLLDPAGQALTLKFSTPQTLANWPAEAVALARTP